MNLLLWWPVLCLTGLETLVHTNSVCSQVRVMKSFLSTSCLVLQNGLFYGTQWQSGVGQVYYKPRETAILNQPVILPSYLHSCEPPIIHGNLTCDTIFIQHNGLIKIGSGSEHLTSLFTQNSLFSFGPQLCLLLIRLFSTVSVAPDTINNHVKTCREEQKSLHFFAPEYGG